MVTMAVGAGVKGQTPHSLDSLYVELEKAPTAADSVSILHNLFDIVPSEERLSTVFKIFNTAERAKDYRAMLEALYVLSMLYVYEPGLEQKLYEMYDRIPDSEIKKTHFLYTKLRFQEAAFNCMSDKDRQRRLHQALKDYRAQESFDKYDRVECLYLICSNLRNTTDSELLLHYLKQFQDLIEKFPYDELPVRALFYSMAINVYIDNEMYDNALVANKRLLDIVGQFDKLHESQGRIFRNYDGAYFNSCRNMLICSRDLSDKEIDACYAKMQALSKKNEHIRTNKYLQESGHIYYLIAKKHYKEAIPLLKEQLKIKSNDPQYYRYANMLVNAARAIGDTESLLYGSEILNSIYRDRLSARPDVSISELQTVYDVDKLKDTNRELNFEKRRMEIERRHQGMVTVLIALAIAMVLLMVLLALYVRSRRLARHLSESNKNLVEERNVHSEIYDRLVNLHDKAAAADNIRSNFVENMSDEINEPLNVIVEYSRLIADYAKADDRPYVREYADAMSLNTDLLIRLVNDILELPQIESGELGIQTAPTSVMDVCDFALEVTRKHLAPGVEMIFANSGQHDTLISTDSQRVEQVLIQLLGNAAKFTQSGSITLSYEMDPQHNLITFSVADTGIGLPPDVEDRIFDRFVKMDPTSQGNGLGLYIGRLLAKMLGGTLTLDSDYRRGAKFDFTIPMR